MPQTAQRIFITGGRGRLASLLAGHFRGGGSETTLFSRKPGDGLRPLGELLHGDAVSQTEIVVHLAWSTLPAAAERNPGRSQREDLPLLEALLKNIAGQPAERRPLLVFFSSGGAVYGNAPGRPNREDDPCQPIGEYGRSKLAAERLIGEHAGRLHLPAVILRVSNPYGYPVPSERQQGLIPHAIRCALSSQPLALWGDGSARKDFLHCSDLLAALEQVFTRRLTGTFNIAAGESCTVREVLDLVEQHSRRTIALATAPPPPWDVHDSRLECSRFRATTGWQPRVSLTEGIRRAVAEAMLPTAD